MGLESHEWSLKRETTVASFTHSTREDDNKRDCLWDRRQVFSRHWVCQHIDGGLSSLQNHEI